MSDNQELVVDPAGEPTVKKAKTRKVGTAAKKAAKRPSKAIVTTTKVKAGKKQPKRKTNGDDGRLVPADLSVYHVDKDKKTPAGNPSIDCADEVATMLRGKALEAVYTLVAKKSGIAEKELHAKYKHLNPGMQRMNLGNKLRGVLNAAE